jgi:hypothetical protein
VAWWLDWAHARGGGCGEAEDGGRAVVEESGVRRGGGWA